MRPIRIAAGESFYSPSKVVEIDWPTFVSQLHAFRVGDETLAEYLALTKAEQQDLKDVGWWSPAHLRDGSRSGADATGMDVLAFDIEGPGASVNAIEAFFDSDVGELPVAFALHSTRKHTPDAPRLRLVLPLTRTVTPDESEALRRAIASRIGFAAVDPVSFRPAQIMFWPSRSRDGEQIAIARPGPWLDPDAALARLYPGGWEDRSRWPRHTKEPTPRAPGGKAEDPTGKPGMVGLFNRAYTVAEAINAFLLPYEPAGEGRWTHVGGTGAGGAVEYGDGLWLYSNHATDPAHGRLLHAFDLCRVHLFRHLDGDAKDGTPVNRLPSHLAMLDLANRDGAVRALMAKEAGAMFATSAGVQDPAVLTGGEQSPEVDISALWSRLDVNSKTGEVVPSFENVLLILRHHPKLQARLGYNHNLDRLVWTRPAPWHDALRKVASLGERDGTGWRDIDALQCKEWMGARFPGLSEVATQRIEEAARTVGMDRAFHPIRDYLGGLEWDGVERIDSFLRRRTGCEDNAYTRAVSRKIFVAGAARALRPGCKFDNMPVLVGGQGAGKSRLVAALVPDAAWLAETLPSLHGGAHAAKEVVRSKWIVEVAEMAGFTRADVEAVKAFISTKIDTVRLPYERTPGDYPRQCLFIGTTNRDDNLRDGTGNRRFWPIEVREIDLEGMDAERDQLWAEAVAAVRAGEALWMQDAEALRGAAEAQEKATETRPEREAIGLWLEGGTDPITGESRAPVERTCVRQVAVEALGYSANGKDWPGWLSASIVEALRGFGFEPIGVRRLGEWGAVKAWARARG